MEVKHLVLIKRFPRNKAINCMKQMDCFYRSGEALSAREINVPRSFQIYCYYFIVFKFSIILLLLYINDSTRTMLFSWKLIHTHSYNAP